MTADTRSELRRLVSALCDGALDEPGHARLEELLAGDEGCRRFYLEYVDMHAGLLSHPKIRSGSPGAAAGRRPPARQTLRYGLVAAATLAASLLFQVVYWHPRPPAVGRGAASTASSPSPPPSGSGAAAEAPGPAPEIYVATLAQTSGCVWEGPGEPWRTGSRLPPGGLLLRRGVARLRFDGGTDLVVEGPAEVRLESSTSATLVRGKVVFRADETAAPFDLRTPSSTLFDIGTEYAVSVDPEGEEIHVFDGEVQRTAREAGGGTEHLKGGEARRYGRAAAEPGEPTALDPSGFVRRVSTPGPSPDDPGAGLLAYEGFDYKDPEAFAAGEATGGTGWLTPWKFDFARPLDSGDRHLSTLDVSASLVRADASVTPVGGCFDYVGFTKSYRRLSKPVRLDTDAVYYLSFLFRRQGPPSDLINAVAVLLRTDYEMRVGPEDPRSRLNIGVGAANELFTHLQKVGSRTPLPLRYGETYLLVAKVAASGSNADQVFMRVYGPDDVVEREEPGSWSVVGPPLLSDLAFDWVELHINSETRQTLDELRLGETWSSVTAPWNRAKK